MTKRAAIYCRISQREEDVDKVENQQLRLEALAAKEGYSVQDVFIDDDISGYTGKERPSFLRMLAAIKVGNFDVIMATEPERFTRRATDMEALQVLCANAGAVLHTIRGGVQDPSSALSRAFGQIMGVFAELETAGKIERQRARNQDELREGKPLWGNRPFGFDVTRLKVEPVEAQAIRDAYDTLLTGGTLYAIATAWNAAGLRTGHAGRKRTRRGSKEKIIVTGLWTTSTVKRVLIRPRNAGILEHKGELLGQTLPAIVTREQWEEVCALLADPSRKPKPGLKTAHLLSGIIRCSCGASMKAGTIHSTKKNGKTYTSDIYRCSMSSTGKGHQSVVRAVADDVVIGKVLGALADGSLVASEPDAGRMSEIQADLTENYRQMDAAQDVLMDPDIKDKSRAKARVKALDVDRERLVQERAALVSQKAQGGALEAFLEYMGRGYAEGTWAHMYGLNEGYEAWESMPLETRRDIIRGSMRVSIGAGVGRERVVVERV